MEPVIAWCISSFLFLLGIFILTVALLRHGMGERIRNRHFAELLWQAKNRNTDWWLDINKHDK
jgi:hypothetical protein